MITQKHTQIFFIGCLIALILSLGIYCVKGTETPQINDTFQTIIDDGVTFPCAELADSLYGIDSRGTDTWCETAACEGEAFHYDNQLNRVYDSNIDIHIDSVWIYDEYNNLMKIGILRSLPKYIIQDNE